MQDQLKIKNCIHKRENTVPVHSQIAAVLYIMRPLMLFPFVLVVVTLAMMRIQSYL